MKPHASGLIGLISGDAVTHPVLYLYNICVRSRLLFSACAPETKSFMRVSQRCAGATWWPHVKSQNASYMTVLKEIITVKLYFIYMKF